MDEYGRPAKTCSKGKDKKTGAMVWRTTCSRCHKEKAGGTVTREQHSRPLVHEPREGGSDSDASSDVLWDDDWRLYQHEVNYAAYNGADQDAERDEEQWMEQSVEEPSDEDRLLAALDSFLRDKETAVGAAAMDELNVTHEQLAEDADVYQAWGSRAAREIMRGAAQLAGFDSNHFPKELKPIGERMAEIIIGRLPSLRTRLAPQSVSDVLAHRDVPARRKRGRPAKHAKDPKKRDGGRSLKYSTFNKKWQDSYPWLMLVPVVDVCSTNGQGECPGCTNCCVMSCSVCLRKKASNSFTDGGGTGVFTERALQLHQHTCHTAEAKAQSLITMFQRGMEDQKTRITALMHEVYWLAKESIATRKFPSLVEHLSASYGLAFGKSYLNKHFATEALKSIAFVLRKVISAWARASTHSALTCDDSTDVEQQKVMLLYIRYPEDGVYVTKFWKALWVHKADCDTLTRLIKDHFAEQDVPMTTLSAFASDGASVVASTGDGVAGRILAINPWAIHCVAHKKTNWPRTKAAQSFTCTELHKRKLRWIAHILDKGWEIGRIQDEKAPAGHKCARQYQVRYPSDGSTWFHVLHPTQYGPDGSWVYVEAPPSKRRSSRRG
jgi:hypothetical protein